MIITDIVKVDDEFYCLLQDYNGIFRFCEESRELELEVRFPNQKIEYKLYNKMVVYDEKVVCIPDYASAVAIYDLKSQKLKMLPLKAPRIEDPFYDGKNKFLAGCLYENFILMIGAKYPALVRIDMHTYKIEYFDEWVNEMYSMDIYKQSWRLFFRRGGTISSGCIYLAGDCAPMCLRIEMYTMRHSWIPICEKEYKVFNDCFANRDKIWFMPVFHDSVIELETKQNLCSEYYLSDNFYENGKAILSEAALLGSILFIFYQNEDKVVMFNVETKKVERIIFVKAAIKDECKGYARYMFARVISDHVVTYSRALDSVIILDQNGEYKIWKLEFSPKYVFSLFANHQTVREQEGYRLKNFIEYIRGEYGKR